MNVLIMRSGDVNTFWYSSRNIGAKRPTVRHNNTWGSCFGGLAGQEGCEIGQGHRMVDPGHMRMAIPSKSSESQMKGESAIRIARSLRSNQPLSFQLLRDRGEKLNAATVGASSP
jgi:hypothetical protein